MGPNGHNTGHFRNLGIWQLHSHFLKFFASSSSCFSKTWSGGHVGLYRYPNTIFKPLHLSWRLGASTINQLSPYQYLQMVALPWLKWEDAFTGNPRWPPRGHTPFYSINNCNINNQRKQKNHHSISNQWLSVRLGYLHCISNEDTIA